MFMTILKITLQSKYNNTEIQQIITILNQKNKFNKYEFQ